MVNSRRNDLEKLLNHRHLVHNREDCAAHLKIIFVIHLSQNNFNLSLWQAIALGQSDGLPGRTWFECLSSWSRGRNREGSLCPMIEDGVELDRSSIGLCQASDPLPTLNMSIVPWAKGRNPLVGRLLHCWGVDLWDKAWLKNVNCVRLDPLPIHMLWFHSESDSVLVVPCVRARI